VCTPFAAPAPDPWNLLTLSDRLDVVQSGVGKANAAGAVARFTDSARHRAVISLGIAGALPAPAPLSLLDVVVGRSSWFADEGIATASGFRSMSDAGFPPRDDLPGDAIAADAALLDDASRWAQVIDAIATVSTCSGTDELAAEVARRYGPRPQAMAEAMEGAAAGLIAWRLRIPFLEVRVISNTTGDRARQRWDIPGALRVLGEVAKRI
jgi:futalosine hydrolase